MCYDKFFQFSPVLKDNLLFMGKYAMVVNARLSLCTELGNFRKMCFNFSCFRVRLKCGRLGVCSGDIVARKENNLILETTS